MTPPAGGLITSIGLRVMTAKVPNKDTESVVSALIKQSQNLPGELYQARPGTAATSLPIAAPIPRSTDLSVHRHAKLSDIARQLNERPRKTSLYKTPAETSLSVLQRSVEPAAQNGPSPISQKPASCPKTTLHH